MAGLIILAIILINYSIDSYAPRRWPGSRLVNSIMITASLICHFG